MWVLEYPTLIYLVNSSTLNLHEITISCTRCISKAFVESIIPSNALRRSLMEENFLAFFSSLYFLFKPSSLIGSGVKSQCYLLILW